MLTCLVCDKELEEFASKIPYDGVDCQAIGNFGSRVWDPDDNTALHFCVCDGCIVKKASQILVATEPLTPQQTFRPFEPNGS